MPRAQESSLTPRRSSIGVDADSAASAPSEPSRKSPYRDLASGFVTPKKRQRQERDDSDFFGRRMVQSQLSFVPTADDDLRERLKELDILIDEKKALLEEERRKIVTYSSAQQEFVNTMRQEERIPAVREDVSVIRRQLHVRREHLDRMLRSALHLRIQLKEAMMAQADILLRERREQAFRHLDYYGRNVSQQSANQKSTLNEGNASMRIWCEIEDTRQSKGRCEQRLQVLRQSRRAVSAKLRTLDQSEDATYRELDMLSNDIHREIQLAQAELAKLKSQLYHLDLARRVLEEYRASLTRREYKLIELESHSQFKPGQVVPCELIASNPICEEVQKLFLNNSENNGRSTQPADSISGSISTVEAHIRQRLARFDISLPTSRTNIVDDIAPRDIAQWSDSLSDMPDDQESPEFNPSQGGPYVLQRLLGCGGFGEVWKAYDVMNGMYVALKLHKLYDNNHIRRERLIRNCKRELSIHRGLSHPRLVRQLVHFRMGADMVASVVEYCDGETLADRLARVKVIREADACIIMSQLLTALQYLADKNVLHFDLKPANILFEEAHYSCLSIKICDFGLARRLDDDDAEGDPQAVLTSIGAGTYFYQPPECFYNKKLPSQASRNPTVTGKVDIWALGVIFYEMLFGTKPFGDAESAQSYWMHGGPIHRQQSFEPKYSPEVIAIAHATFTNTRFAADPAKAKQFPISEDAIRIISSCLSHDPEQRPTVYMLCRDPYFMEKIGSRGTASRVTRPDHVHAPSLLESHPQPSPDS